MRTVHELRQEELEELQDSYFHQLIDLGEESFTMADEIPMGDVIVHYEGINFVDEDFLCNIEK